MDNNYSDILYSNLKDYYGEKALPDIKTFNEKIKNDEYKKIIYSNLSDAYGKDALPEYNTFLSKFTPTNNYTPEQLSEYKWSDTITQSPSISTPTENVNVGITGNTQLKPKSFSEIMPKSLFQHIAERFVPSKEAQKTVIKDLTTVEKATPSLLTPEAQVQKNTDDVVNAFTDFRNIVPNTDIPEVNYALQDDLSKTGFVPTKLKTPEGKEYTKLEFKPQGIEQLDFQTEQFRKQYELKVKEINAKYDKLQYDVESKYGTPGDDSDASTIMYNTKDEVKKIREAKQKELDSVNKAWGKLNSLLQNKALEAKENHLDKFTSIDLENKNIEGISETFKESNKYFKSLTQQTEADRKRYSGDLAIDVETLGNPEERIKRKEYRDVSDKIDPSLLSVLPIKKQGEEYYGTKLQIDKNERDLDVVLQQKAGLQKQYTEYKKSIDDALKDLAAKGLTLNDLTSESRNQILKAQEDLGKFENAIKDADENIALRKQYSEQLFSDVTSLKDFITYKSEKEKLRRLYEDSPWATTAVEIGSYLTKDLVKTTGKMLSQSKVLYGRNDLNEQDKQDYLTKIAESTEFTPKVEIDYEGQYTPLKDVSAIQMFDKEGNLDPKLHPQALFFQTGKTAGEMIYIASPAGVLRRGALTLGGEALAKEIAIREAVAATEIGTTFGEKAALKGLQAVEWTGRTTSLVPSTYVLFSPEMIDQELKKGLSTSDIKTAVNLRIAAESLSENLLLDDVKFLDNLLKKGEIRTYEQLMKSDAYRTIMDNLSLKVAGKKLSELEYKALFDPKILKSFVKVTGDKIAPYAVGATRGLSVQVEESGEEVASNFFNVLIDTYIASKNPNYEKGEEFTIENQVNTVLQTMATMIPMGVSQAVKSYKEEQADRTYGMNLAAYQVAITPKVFQENLLEQYKESQRTKNPMSKEELTVRMAELDKFGKIYESLGFSKDKEKEALQNEIQSITIELGKDEKFKDKIPTLEYEIQKQAERNLRNREFEAFSAALKKNEYENEFLNAKTDKEKEVLFEKIEEKLLDVEKLKEKREEDKKKVEEAKQKEREQYNQSFQETIDVLEQNNNNIDEYLNQFEDLNSLNQELETLSQLKEHPDERIKNLSTSLYTELNNKLYQLSEETVEDPTTFSKTEQEFISQLPVNPEDVTKTEDGIVVNIDGEQVLFSSLKEIQDVFNQKDEKTEKALKYQRAIDDLEILQQEIPIPDGIQVYYSNNKGKFAIDVPGEETIEFDTIDEVKEYLLNPTPKEDVQQTNLTKFNNEIDSLYEEYKDSKKKPASKESWLNQEGTKKKLKKLRDKYGIEQPIETKKVTESPIEIKEFTDEQILETNSISNLETLSSNGIIYKGYKLVNASGLLAYQSRGFEEIEDETSTEIIENVNELNKEFLFLLSPNFNVGEEFTIVVKPVSDSNFIEQEKEELRNNARFLIEQGISQEEITSDLENDENFKEIQVFTKDGKYAGTIHSLSYIRPARVVDYLEDEDGNKIPNLAPNYKQLKQLRESLVANEKDVTLKLTSKNSGWLAIKYQDGKLENSPLSESFENKETLNTIQVVSKTSTTRHKGKESLNEAKSGSTVVSIITPNNQVFALSLQKRKLKTLEVSTITDSISLHTEYNRLLNLESTSEIKETIKYLEEFANNVSEEYNILTPEGLKQYIQLFVHANSKTSDFKNKAKREGTENIPFIDVDVTDRGDFRITFSNSRTFEAEMDTELSEAQLDLAMGIYRFTLSELKDKGTFNKFSALFKEHLLNRTVNHSTELSNTTSKFKIPFIKATKSKAKPFIKVEETELEKEGLTSQYKSYKDFLIETSLTPIIETKLPDGTYSYFQQPNIEITPSISKKETYKDIEVIDTEDIKTQTGEIGAASYDRKNKVIKLNRNLLQKKFEEKAWTNPRKQKDDSFAEALDENIFPTYKDFENFVIEHEFQHSLLSREEFDKLPKNKDKKTTTGEYEDYINNQALEVLGLQIEKSKEKTPSKDIEADISIGKVGNINYEVKSDGVYFEGKKLDNPDNKSNRQLIEADIEKRRQEELDKNSGTSKIINLPTQNEQEARNKSEKILEENKELVDQLEKEFTNEDETLFNDLVEKLEKLLSDETEGEVSFGFREGKIFLTVDKVKKGNIINLNYTNSRKGQIGEFEVGDTVQVNNGSVAIPSTVTKVSSTGRIVEAQDKNGTITIRNGVVLGSNVIQREKEINAKYDAELAALEQPKIEEEKQIIPTTEKQLVEKSKELTETDVTSLDDIISSLDEELGKLAKEETNQANNVIEVENAIKTLPIEIFNTVEVIDVVPLDILGRDDLYLSIKDILNNNNIKDEVLINWVGINKDKIQHPKSIKSEQELNEIISKRLKSKQDESKYIEFKINPLALKSFNEWKDALKDYPLVFQDIMLSHAIKHIINPQRKSKYVLQLSKVALTNTYGILMNQPNEANRLGKLYDKEVLATVSDAVDHEPSASGNGYWVHVPRTTQNEYRVELQKDSGYYGIFRGDSFLDEYSTRNEAFQEVEKLRKESLTSSQFKVNVELLRKLSPSTWCTASSMTDYYVQNYDNYLLIVNGVTVAGIEAYPTNENQQAINYQEEKLKELEKFGAYKLNDSYRIKGITNYVKKITNYLGFIENFTGKTRQELNENFKKRAEELEIGYELEIRKVKSTIEFLKSEKPITKVKEVTSRGNNGVAPIDHIEDIVAFFEKHNLDLDNNSVQRALKAKEQGKTDADVFKNIADRPENWQDFEQTEEEYWAEREAIDRFNGEYEYDPPEYDDYDYDYGIEEDMRIVAAMTTLDEVNASLTLVVSNFNALLPELRDNEKLANDAIDYDAHNIIHISDTVPFYNELVLKAVTKSPYVFEYLGEVYKNLPGIREMYNEYQVQRAAEIDDLPFSKTNTNQIQGYYDAKNDKVVVVASNTPVNEAAKVAIHEVAHRGMLRMAKDLGGTKELGEALFAAEKQLMKKLPELLKRTGHKDLESLMLDYGFDKTTEDGKIKLLMELAARWAETLTDKPQPSWWKKLIQNISEWITKFTGKTLNEKEVNELVGGFVQYGTKQKNELKQTDITEKNVTFVTKEDLNKLDKGKPCK